MRQLTASQKIAVLEHRIARLEKQAMLSKIKKTLRTSLSGLSSTPDLSLRCRRKRDQEADEDTA